MMDDYGNLTAVDMIRLVRKKEINAVELAKTALNLAESEGKHLNAVITVCRGKAMAQARNIDRIVKGGGNIPLLAGVPVIIKDNIIYSGYPTTCGSRILEGYVSPYDATCVRRLEQSGAVIVGKANMDEFAMGSSNETSAYGPVKNPVCDGLVPGGSSGGSCAAVAAGIVPIAYGSDTGGSVRQPAGFCGVVGLKPSYGSVSRYGLTAFASSTDQIGPIARNVTDCALAYEAVVGYDADDSTSVRFDHPVYSREIENRADRKFRFGVAEEYFSEGIDAEVRACVENAIKRLDRAGHQIVNVSLPHTDLAIAAYYIIANAEASSNLARFDGARYGFSAGRDKGLSEMYFETRGEGFGAEVKRRIMLGTFVLSAGYYDAYYLKAQKIREIIRRDFENLFEKADLMLSPTSPTAAFRLGEKLNDPLEMYLSDILTVPANLAGIPAISIPCGKTSDGRPVGLQITGSAFVEADLLIAARQAEELMGYQNADD
jgi:aspartyl-tRNA(Asn)/glutamyl-tRNA(Gln) amidotransferase subunit A